MSFTQLTMESPILGNGQMEIESPIINDGWEAKTARVIKLHVLHTVNGSTVVPKRLSHSSTLDVSLDARLDAPFDTPVAPLDAPFDALKGQQSKTLSQTFDHLDRLQDAASFKSNAKTSQTTPRNSIYFTESPQKQPLFNHSTSFLDMSESPRNSIVSFPPAPPPKDPGYVKARDPPEILHQLHPPFRNLSSLEQAFDGGHRYAVPQSLQGQKITLPKKGGLTRFKFFSWIRQLRPLDKKTRKPPTTVFSS
jgi:hypothetical protein